MDKTRRGLGLLNLRSGFQRAGRFLPALLSLSLIVLFLADPAKALGQPALPSSRSPASPSPDALFDLDRLPLLRPGVQCRMFSSYDRSGGNNDGFSGTYSALRMENGNSVIAEMKDAGCIQRIWFTHSLQHEDGLLNRRGEHIRIYLDGNQTPALDVPLEQLFAGKLSAFPKPLVGTGLGGFYCYVPIPYRNGCKIVIQGNGVRFYQVTYTTFPSSDGIETFSLHPSPGYTRSLAKALDAWSHPGDPAAVEGPETTLRIFPLTLKAGAESTVKLPRGPRMIRSISLEGDEINLENALKARLRIAWDGAKTSAVDLPLDYFFGQAMHPAPYRSLLMGNSDTGYYNFIPMPYSQSAAIRLVPPVSCHVTLKIALEPLQFTPPSYGYLHANYLEELPTEDGLPFPFLNTKGRGQFLGVYLTTKGNNKEPAWLEGDDIVHVDGELRIHGTGTEDYFNCGWYSTAGRLNEAGAFPVHGFPVFRATSDTVHTASYRWHVPDVIPYQHSIRFDLEHGPQNDWPADYRAAVYFYDTRPAAVANDPEPLFGDACVHYLEQRTFQFALGDARRGRTKVKQLQTTAQSPIVRVLLKGVAQYLNGMDPPDPAAIDRLQQDLRTLDDLTTPSASDAKSGLTQAAFHKLHPGGRQKAIATARTILLRAQNDLRRRVARSRGFHTGDELIVEARDPWGTPTAKPRYRETGPFMSSTAKVDDVRLIGKGARFSMTPDAATSARFTPDIPKPGLYKVSVIFSFGANAADTQYVVRHADGTTTIPLQQRGRPGTPQRNNDRWLPLGTYRFDAGIHPERGSVTLLVGRNAIPANPDIHYRAYADSVLFSYCSANSSSPPGVSPPSPAP